MDCFTSDLLDAFGYGDTLRPDRFVVLKIVQPVSIDCLSTQVNIESEYVLTKSDAVNKNNLEPNKSARRNHVYASTVYYPTLWWNVWNGRILRRWQWWNEINDDLVLGAVPFRRDVSRLLDIGVRAVVNTCEEFAGHSQLYQEFQITQHHMPTIDFTHPTLESVVGAVKFMQEQVGQGRRVYVHCKAGRARSATVVMCYLMAIHGVSAEEAQEQILQCRKQVLPTVYRRPVIQQFAEYWERNSRIQAAAGP